MLRGMLKKFLQRLDTFLGHFEVILFKSQKAFLRCHQDEFRQINSHAMRGAPLELEHKVHYRAQGRMQRINL